MPRLESTVTEIAGLCDDYPDILSSIWMMEAMASELNTSEGKERPLEAATPILLTLKHLPQNLQ